MRKTQWGQTILEGQDVADLPLVSQNAEIVEREVNNRYNELKKICKQLEINLENIDISEELGNLNNEILEKLKDKVNKDNVVNTVNGKKGNVSLFGTDIKVGGSYGHNITLFDIASSQIDSLKDIDSLKKSVDKKMDKSGGEFSGITKAHSNTSYTVGQIRNVILSPNEANSSSMNNGDIWIQYK